MAVPERRDRGLWGPQGEMHWLQQQLQHTLNPWGQGGDGFTPLADLEESDDAYCVEVELPGVDKDDVSVDLAGRRLIVVGERKERERVGILRSRTRSTGRFHYEVTLPGEADEEGVEANLDSGVLTVRLPKAARERRRQIKVR
jgi:HSP20 family protein